MFRAADALPEMFGHLIARLNAAGCRPSRAFLQVPFPQVKVTGATLLSAASAGTRALRAQLPGADLELRGTHERRDAKCHSFAGVSLQMLEASALTFDTHFRAHPVSALTPDAHFRAHPVSALTMDTHFRAHPVNALTFDTHFRAHPVNALTPDTHFRPHQANPLTLPAHH